MPDAVTYSIDQFRDWIFKARRGELCLFHVGQMAVDQQDRPLLKDLSAFASIMSDYNIAITTQRRASEGIYQYFATRTDAPANLMPKSLAMGSVTINTFIAIRAISKKQEAYSLRRAIRDAMLCSEIEAQAMLDVLVKQKFVSSSTAPKDAPNYAAKSILTSRGYGVLL